MAPFAWIEIAVTFAALLTFAPLLGRLMADIFESTSMARWRVVERWIYRLGGIDESTEMSAREYLVALLVFNAVGFVTVFALQMLQAQLPLNPQHLANTPWDLAFNTAVSFMTNTNWQSYAGETTLSYLTQMLGLTVQNFVSAAAGIAVLLGLTRGLVRQSSQSIGNFWVDLTRSTLYVLLPLSILLAAMLVHQGVIQNFDAYVNIKSLEGASQSLPMGPAASQIAIKQIGTNGGGFFNANSAHPFENPTPFSNWLELLAILLIPASLPFTFGAMVKDRRQGRAIFVAMLILLLLGLSAALYAEHSYHPFGAAAAMEGKETRFGVADSILWSIFTTVASNGSVNAMHDSLSPLAGGVAMLNIMLGEVIFGGVGAGLYGMLIFVVLTVFIAGLMVGRTPEYLGKKIEAHEMIWVVTAVLLPSVVILLGSAASVVLPAALSGLNNQGPHGLSEILYAYASAAGNNGSAFAGLSANTLYYNTTLGLGMLMGRFGVIVPALLIAGSLAGKKRSPPSPGTFPTDGALFIALLIAVVLIVGALTFFPVLALGPIIEHFLLATPQVF